MEDLSLHILDIVENSINAGAKNVELAVREDFAQDLLRIEIIDDGKGMSAEVVQKVTDPFYTTRRTRKIGLGLSLLSEATRMANGRMHVHSVPGCGTKVTATFQLSHIDRQPLGNIADTIVAIVAGNPGVEITYMCERNGCRFVFDTRKIKAELQGVQINSACVLNSIKQHILKNTQNFFTGTQKIEEKKYE